MPKAISADWDAMKAAYLKGVPLPEVASQFGVSYQALRARAHRQGWRASAAAGAAMLQQSVTITMQERGEEWGKRIGTLVERRLTYLEKLDDSKLSLKEMEMLSRITETTDKTARRTFGLDQQAQPSVNLGLVLGIVPDNCHHPLPAMHIHTEVMPDPETGRDEVATRS